MYAHTYLYACMYLCMHEYIYANVYLDTTSFLPFVRQHPYVNVKDNDTIDNCLNQMKIYHKLYMLFSQASQS